MSTASATAEDKSPATNWRKRLSDPLRQLELNPVLTKDLRQAARSWTVIGAVMLLLAIYYFIALTFLLNSEFADRARNNAGPILFGFIGFGAMVGGYLFIPFYVAVRTMMERASINADLIYITTMSPQRIAWGKLLSGVYLIVLFYSASVPFLVFSYLLRGIDLVTVALSITITFLMNILLLQGAITLAVTRMHVALKVLIGLFVGVPVIISAISFTVIAIGSHEFARFVGSPMLLNQGAAIVGTFLLNWALVMGLLFQAAVAQISPPSANRALPFRSFLTAAWLLFVLELFIWSWRLGDDDAIIILLTTVGSLVILGLFMIIGGPDKLSRRVKRQIPWDPVGRRFAFLFFNGTLSGMIWLLLIALGTLGLVCGFEYLWTHHPPAALLASGGRMSFLYNDSTEIYLFYVTMIMYTFGYGLISKWIHGFFFPKRTPRLACVFFLVLVILPSLFVLLASVLLYNQPDSLTVPGIPLSIFSTTYSYSPGYLIDHFALHLAGAMGTVLIGLAINYKWVRQQFTQFFYLNQPDTVADPDTDPHA